MPRVLLEEGSPIEPSTKFIEWDAPSLEMAKLLTEAGIPNRSRFWADAEEDYILEPLVAFTLRVMAESKAK